MKSIKPRKQRKFLYNAPLHKKRKWISSHLDEKILLKYDRRSMPVIKGDTVRVMRGSYKGHENKVANVNVKDGTIEIEGITTTKADGNKIARPVHPSNVMIIKLNLTDKWRRNKLEKELSEETRKEIEKEAQEQLKEEEEKRKEEEAKALEEKKEKTEELEEEIPAEKPEPKAVDKTVEEKTKQKTKPKKEEKPKTKKETTDKKKPVKKTPAKKQNKKEESK